MYVYRKEGESRLLNSAPCYGTFSLLWPTWETNGPCIKDCVTSGGLRYAACSCMYIIYCQLSIMQQHSFWPSPHSFLSSSSSSFYDDLRRKEARNATLLCASINVSNHSLYTYTYAYTRIDGVKKKCWLGGYTVRTHTHRHRPAWHRPPPNFGPARVWKGALVETGWTDRQSERSLRGERTCFTYLRRCVFLVYLPCEKGHTVTVWQDLDSADRTVVEDFLIVIPHLCKILLGHNCAKGWSNCKSFTSFCCFWTSSFSPPLVKTACESWNLLVVKSPKSHKPEAYFMRIFFWKTWHFPRNVGLFNKCPAWRGLRNGRQSAIYRPSLE